MLEFNSKRKELVSSPFLVDSVIDRLNNATVLVDTGCNAVGVINSEYTRQHKLRRVPIKPRNIYAYDDRPAEKVEAVVKADVDVGGLRSTTFLYEVRHVEDQDIILGTPWMDKNEVVIDVREKALTFKRHGITVRAVLPEQQISMISAAGFKFWKMKAMDHRE